MLHLARSTPRSGEAGPRKKPQAIAYSVVLMGLLCSVTACPDAAPPRSFEGTWECRTAWTWDRDGDPVPCSVVHEATCQDNRVTATGTLSLGDAQWEETIEATIAIEGDDIRDTRTLSRTEPMNDAARQYERDRHDGEPRWLKFGDTPRGLRSRVVTWSPTQLVTLGDEGKTTTCRKR
jgi:hypothetical protein